MAAIQAFNAQEFINSLASLALAFFLGMLIGSERQYRQRTAGLRTTVLVSVGAAAFVDLGMRLTGNPAALQVVAYVVSGVGFLGAGVIMKEGMNVRGLNTAATLWSSAAVGAFSGADLLAEATLLAAFILAGNTFLRSLVNFTNRIPIDERAGEATYEIEVTCPAGRAPQARELLIQRAEARGGCVRLSKQGAVKREPLGGQSLLTGAPNSRRVSRWPANTSSGRRSSRPPPSATTSAICSARR